MQSKPISRYIYFGTSLRFLQDVEQGWPVREKDWVLDNIDNFLQYLEEFNLVVTQRASNCLVELADKFRKSKSGHKLTSTEASELSELMRDIRQTLFAEAGGNIAFIVTEKRLDVDKLLNDVPALMAPGIFNALPEIARYDFNEAGKCIAFQRPTAAAFHLLRGTEAVLREFYCCIVKRDRVEKLLWGPIVDHLRRRRTSPPQELLNNLDNIRLSYRNPTQHPERIYDIHEVQDLLGLCVNVVNQMGKTLKKS